MKHITEEGYKNMIAMLEDAITSIDADEIALARIRIRNAIGILKANKDTKPRKKKKAWDDEWWG
ncbi:MAG: hypothetical protein IKG63_04300 [Streptococcus sp.]|nr:hypothetical protein [Streptococcus sp.]